MYCDGKAMLKAFRKQKLEQLNGVKVFIVGVQKSDPQLRHLLSGWGTSDRVRINRRFVRNHLSLQRLTEPLRQRCHSPVAKYLMEVDESE